MKLFRGCRYQVVTHTPNEGLWSRHHSLQEARRSFTTVVNNQRGDHRIGMPVELVDIEDGTKRSVMMKGWAK
jgi:hypothetical protein